MIKPSTNITDDHPPQLDAVAHTSSEEPNQSTSDIGMSDKERLRINLYL